MQIPLKKLLIVTFSFYFKNASLCMFKGYRKNKKNTSINEKIKFCQFLLHSGEESINKPSIKNNIMSNNNLYLEALKRLCPEESVICYLIYKKKVK